MTMVVGSEYHIIPARELRRLEKAHRQGFTSRQIIDFLVSYGECTSMATLRKYVQMGMVPRSLRVAIQGSAFGPSRGSIGMYPVTALRAMARVKGAIKNGHSLRELAEWYAQNRFCGECGRAYEEGSCR